MASLVFPVFGFVLVGFKNYNNNIIIIIIIKVPSVL